jgi:DNA repair protein RadC
MKHLPADQRPREKLLTRGPGALADAELLALLLRTGLAGRGVLELAADVLSHCGGFAGLVNTDAAALKGVKGLGPAKRAELLAVAEIARRALAERLTEAPAFASLPALKEYVALHLVGRPHETFAVLFFDKGQRLLALEELFHGTLDQTPVFPREVLRRTLAHNAAAVVVAHNHPNGQADPSSADVAITHVLAEALKLIDVKLVDHLIVGRGQVLSMAEKGSM